MSRCHFGGGLFMIHSFSFKCESHLEFVPLQKYIYKKKKKKIITLVWWSSTRWYKFLFFKCVWTLRQRKLEKLQTSLWPITLCRNGSRRRRREETDGRVFDAWRHASVFFEGLFRDEGGDPCWPATCRDSSLSSGTPEDLQHVLWKHSSALRSGHVCEKVLRSRGRAGSCVIFSTASELSYLKKHPFVLLHY